MQYLIVCLSREEKTVGSETAAVSGAVVSPEEKAVGGKSRWRKEKVEERGDEIQK